MNVQGNEKQWKIQPKSIQKSMKNRCDYHQKNAKVAPRSGPSGTRGTPGRVLCNTMRKLRRRGRSNRRLFRNPFGPLAPWDAGFARTGRPGVPNHVQDHDKNP